MILLVLVLWITTVSTATCCFSSTGSCHLIETSPCYCEVATNYTGFLLSFKTYSSKKFSLTFLNGRIAFTITNTNCTILFFGLNFLNATCTKKEEFFHINLILVSVLQEGNVTLRCLGDNKNSISSFYYKDCILLNSDHTSLSVTPRTGIFNTTGTFSCSGSGMLYTKSGSKLLNNQTKCIKNATWEHADNMECWSANLTISNTTYKQDNQVTVDCVLEGNSSEVNFSKVILLNDKPWNISALLEPEQDNASVSCRLIINNSSEINSNPSRIVVLYRPTSIETKNINKTLFINGKYFLQANAAISLNCSFIANPPSNCCWVENKTNETLNCTTSKNGCQLTKLFNISTDVKCKGCNIVGCNSSQVLSIVPLSMHKNPTIFVNSSLKENFSLWTFNVTQVVHLQCNVSYQDDLSTTIKWFHNGLLQNNGTLGNNLLVDLNVNSGGNYTCQANDTFLSSNASVEIIVHYKPYQPIKKGTCYLGDTGSCTFNISSNPPATNASLTRLNDSNVTDLSTSLDSNSNVFQLVINETYTLGEYLLVVSNSQGTLNFTFNVTNESAPTTTSSQTTEPGTTTTTSANQNMPYYIGAGVLAFVVALLAPAMGIKHYRGKKQSNDQSEREERQNPIYATSGDANANGSKDIYTPVNFKEKKNKKVNSEKEERANPLYASSSNQDAVQDVYASVDKKKKEKEVCVNPIYDTSVASGSKEVTYGVVNKKNKKIKVKSEKEVKVNVLYGASGSGNQLEDAYASVDQSKKNEKEERLNPLYGGLNDVAGSSGDTYSTVNKPNKKKKKKDKKRDPPPNPPDPGEQDADPYAEVDLHGQSSNK